MAHVPTYVDTHPCLLPREVQVSGGLQVDVLVGIGGRASALATVMGTCREEVDRDSLFRTRREHEVGYLRSQNPHT